MPDPDPGAGRLSPRPAEGPRLSTPGPIEALLVDVTSVAFARFASDGVLIDANQGFREAVRVPAGVVRLSDLLATAHGDDLGGALATRRTSRARRYVQFAAGADRAVSLLASWVWDGDELLFLGELDRAEPAASQLTLASLTRQVSELTSENERKSRQLERAHADLQAARASIESLSWRDDVTGLASPRWLTEVLHLETERAQRYLQPFCLVMVDVDSLGTINDSSGRAAGDQMLKTVANALIAAVRTTDVVCRYRGGTFLTMLPNCALDQARVVAERMRTGIAGAISPSDHAPLATSVGVAQWLPGDAVAALVQRVELSLTEAKGVGRAPDAGGQPGS